MIKLLLLVVIAIVFAPVAIFGQTPVGSAVLQFDESRLLSPGDTTFRIDTLIGQSGPVTGRPLSADEVNRSVQVLSDKSRIENSEVNHLYRDAMGRMRIETASGVLIYDPVAGFSYQLATDRKTYTQSPISPAAVVMVAARAHQSAVTWNSGDAMSARTGSKPVTEALPAQAINGIYVRGSRSTVTIPAGAVGNNSDLRSVSERWYSDDLDLLVRSLTSDPRFGTTTYELANIVQGLPDPALFRIPSGYTLIAEQ